VATRFVRAGDGTITCSLAGEEAVVLTNLLGQLIELLSDDRVERGESGGDDELAQLIGRMGSTEPPSDPVLSRLLPAAYDDEEQAGEFRRFTEADLRTAKVDGAQAVIDDLGDVSQSDRVTLRLDDDDALTLLRTLNDLRLTLGTRLEVSEDDPDDRFEALPEHDPTRWTFEVYAWLGWLQETLVDALDQPSATDEPQADE
jgi:Domain of unknown function (DUF2017)